MTEEEARERIDKLTADLHRHNHLYYVVNQPAIGDFQFDQMMKELEELEAQFPHLAHMNSPTTRVGGDVTKEFPTVRHKWPMLSLANSYSREELRDFDQRVRKGTNGSIRYTCELKYDGVAIGVTYRDGELLRAVTRGDGVEGEDITPNVRTIRSIPLTLQGSDYPREFEIRGEIFMRDREFERINREQREKGDTVYANPRNLTAGTLKLQDSAVVAQRNLDCYLYAFYAEENPFETHYESLLKIREWGFKVPSPEDDMIRQVPDIEGVIDFADTWERRKAELDFEVDGVVCKVDAYKVHRQLGSTAKSPRWAMAYKFATEQVETGLKAIGFQVGRTGRVTPVAKLEPVHIGGTTVKSATLHNADYIKELDIREGDSVYVEKGGEIIPKVVGVNKEKRPGDLFSQPFSFIDHCPECGTPLKRYGADYFCPDPYGCPPQRKGMVEHFISRRALDIDGLGPETIELLFEKDLVRNVADLYDLGESDLLPLEGVQEKTVNNLLSAIEGSKEVPFERVLYGLGIPFVGETVARKLARHFRTIDALRNATKEELEAVEDIGEKIAESVRGFFADHRNLELIERLKEHGLKMAVEEEEEGSSNKLEGASLVVSGVFSRFSRDELKEMIERNGGKVTGSVSGNTTYLVAGENIGPSKRQKAEKLGVPIISEDEFLEKVS